MQREEGGYLQETNLGEYNMFEEEQSSYSGSNLLIAMGAGIVCGFLGVFYVKRKEY